MSWSKDEMAAVAAEEIADGMVINLGIGIPTLIANHLSAKPNVWIQSENGLLGMGPFPYEDEADPQLINAGKQTVTVVPGGSTFDSGVSFSMIRGGHIDLAFLGTMQVSCAGDLANWSIPGGRTLGIGGAMDLAAGAQRIVVLTQHVTKKGESKLVSQCSYPLTARAVVSRVVTDLGVFDVAGDTFVAVRLASGVSQAQATNATAAPLRF